MASSKRTVIPLLIGLLAAAILTALFRMPLGGEEAGATPEPRGVVTEIVIPAAAFTPTEDNVDYRNGAADLSLTDSGDLEPWMAQFIAPVAFPQSQVTIRKITLYAYDHTRSGRVCAAIGFADPIMASGMTASGELCTRNSRTNPQVISTREFFHRNLDQSIHAGFVYLNMDPGNCDPAGTGPELCFYAVKITYVS